MIKLHYSYRKTCGLPGYSSASASAEVEVELVELNELERTCSNLYSKLQGVVDRELADRPGFVPDHGYGMDGKSQASGNGAANSNGQNGSNGHSNGNGYSANGNGHPANGSNGHNGDAWNCSDKQRELITKLVGEHHLDKGEVDATSHDMFGVGVKDLNKLQASGLIERILDEHGGGRKGNGARSRSTPPRRQYVNEGTTR